MTDNTARRFERETAHLPGDDGRGRSALSLPDRGIITPPCWWRMSRKPCVCARRPVCWPRSSTAARAAFSPTTRHRAMRSLGPLRRNRDTPPHLGTDRRLHHRGGRHARTHRRWRACSESGRDSVSGPASPPMPSITHKPFLSPTGYRSFLGVQADIVPDLTPDSFAHSGDRGLRAARVERQARHDRRSDTARSSIRRRSQSRLNRVSHELDKHAVLHAIIG